jgi:hypothetical protein
MPNKVDETLGGNMITIKNLPLLIKEVAQKYQRNDKRLHVFPSIFLIESNKYYLFMYEPSRDEIMISEDGNVHSKTEVKKSFLYAFGYNSSIENISNIGGSWVKSGTIQRYNKLNRILTKLESIIAGEAPDEVLKSLEVFKEASRTIIKEQENISHCVEKGLVLTVETNDREIVTIEDYKQMRRYNDSMVRSAYKQSQIQLDTEEDRKKVFDYVSNNKFSFGFKLVPIAIQLAPYKKYMRTSKTYGSDEMVDIKIMISKDYNIEEDTEALAAVETLRNPD